MATPSPSQGLSTQTEATDPTPDVIVPEEKPTFAAAPTSDAVSEQVEVAASPLEQAFGLQLDPEILSAEYAAAYQGWTDDVTRCMRRAGFAEYTEDPLPVPPPDDFRLVQSTGELAGVYEFGYSLSASLLRAIEPERATPIPQDETDLQMREMFRSFSATERDTFRHTRGACFEEAAEQNPTPDELESAKIAEEIQQVRVAAQASPPMITLWSEWSSCMAGHGFSFNDRSEAGQSLVPEANATGSLLASEGRTPAVIDAIKELAAKEAELVAIDIGCSEQIDLLERAQQISTSFETEWLENNGDRVNLLLQEADRANGN